MKKRTPVSKIMSSDIATVSVVQQLSDVDELLRDRNIRHVPVTSGKRVIGMLSRTDLQKISFVNTIDGDEITTAMWENLSIEQVMTTDVRTVQRGDTIMDVAAILAKEEFHALPVLDGDELVGIVTTTDLVQYLLDQF